MAAPINDFKAFATSVGANVESQAAYELDPSLSVGFATGVANSSRLNKVWRQSSFIAAAIAQFVANAGPNVLDDGNINNFLNLFLNAKNGFYTKNIAGSANVTLDPFNEANNLTIMLTGAITANIIVFMPLNRDGAWNIINATTGAFTVEIRTTGAAGVIISSASSLVVVSDGVTCRSIGASAVIAPAAMTGEYFYWPLGSTPSYGLVCNGAAVSRTVYSALFAIIGTTYGAGNGTTVFGDGSTTFNVPNIPRGYALTQGIGNEGISTVGQVIAHTHTYNDFNNYGTYYRSNGGNDAINLVAGQTAPTGGPANLAASVYSRICIRF